MNTLRTILAYLDGMKTYLLVLGGILLVAGTSFGWWTTKDVEYLWAVLALLGVGAGRSMLKKFEK